MILLASFHAPASLHYHVEYAVVDPITQNRKISKNYHKL